MRRHHCLLACCMCCGCLSCALFPAGINKNSAAEDTEEQDWDATFSINTKGVFLCCQVWAWLVWVLREGGQCCWGLWVVNMSHGQLAGF